MPSRPMTGLTASSSALLLQLSVADLADIAPLFYATNKSQSLTANDCGSTTKVA